MKIVTKLVKDIQKKYNFNYILGFENELDICSCFSSENISLIEKVIERENFIGKAGETLSVNLIVNEELVNYNMLGFGKKEEFEKNKALITLFESLKKRKGSILISSKEELLADSDIIAEVEQYLNYSFDKYKTED